MGHFGRVETMHQAHQFTTSIRKHNGVCHAPPECWRVDETRIEPHSTYHERTPLSNLWANSVHIVDGRDVQLLQDLGCLLVRAGGRWKLWRERGSDTEKERDDVITNDFEWNLVAGRDVWLAYQYPPSFHQVSLLYFFSGWGMLASLTSFCLVEAKARAQWKFIVMTKKSIQLLAGQRKSRRGHVDPISDSLEKNNDGRASQKETVRGTASCWAATAGA